MEAHSWVMLRVLLNHFHTSVGEATLRCLPSEEMKAVLSQNIANNDPTLIIDYPQLLLNKIHHSWILPILQALPSALHEPLLSLLPLISAAKLRKQLHIHTPAAPPPAAIVRSFLTPILYRDLLPHPVLPIEYLPETPLAFLTDLNATGLMELINLLGIYDITESVRQIIDQKRLKQINSCLTSVQKRFLHIALHQPEKVISTRLQLDKWNGDCGQLRLLLTQRGMARFGKALCGQHPDFFWHITHLLDMRYAEELSKYFSPVAVSGMTPILVQQVITTNHFLNNKGRS